jgi:hypothetical protein
MLVYTGRRALPDAGDEPDVDTLNYLAYGSNLYPPRLRARIALRAERGTVALDGWTLAFGKRGGDGSAKCTLLARAGARAWGAVYAIDPAAKATLDAIEGAGHGYTVHWLECPPHGPCFLYLAAAATLEPGLAPFDWYKAYVLAGARYHALPPDYIEAIAGVAARADPDRARAAENFARIAGSPPARHSP